MADKDAEAIAKCKAAIVQMLVRGSLTVLIDSDDDESLFICSENVLIVHNRLLLLCQPMIMSSN